MFDLKKSDAIFTRYIKHICLLACVMMLAACELPPMETQQQGYRGLGMENVVNPRIQAKLNAENIVPQAAPPVDASGPRAADVFQNVQILGDLSVGQFTRLMTSLTAWVSPEEGCNYCHIPEDLASDDIYTKRVSRAMLQMTIDANTHWQDHVGDTGVTCYTCHRGKPVPTAVWAADPGPAHAKGINRPPQNIGSDVVAYTSLPYDPFTPFLSGSEEILVIGEKALPNQDSVATIEHAEWTYGLMMHLSDSLGVNCTHCHNSRSFFDWDQSSEARKTAWYAIRHVREINNKYIQPLTDDLPDSRKGPLGDPLKANCNTCHRGLNKPLGGAQMINDYPSLTKRE